jgi:protein O-GlcNAc transferase
MMTTGQQHAKTHAIKEGIANVIADSSLLLSLEQNFKADAKSHVPPSKSELDGLLTSYNQGLLDRAKLQAINLTKRSPKHALAWKILGVIYQKEEATDEAEFALRKAAELAPKDAEAHYNLANYYYDQHLLKEAQISYQKAIKLVPNFVQAIFNLACVSKDMGQNSQAEIQFKKGIKLDSSHAAMYFNLAEVIAQQNRHQEAVSYYKKANALNPQDTQSLLRLGVAYLTLGKYEEAAEPLLEVLKLDEKNASAYNTLGLIYQNKKQEDIAEQHFQRAIELRPDYAAPYKNLGLLYKDMGKVYEAKACYSKVLKLEIPTAETLNNLAVLNINEGLYLEAEQQCRDALEINPLYGDSWNNLGLILQSRMYSKEAEAAFEQAIKCQPNDVQTLVNYSVTLTSLGKLAKAEQYLKKAIKLDPKFENSYINLGNTYLNQNLIDAAINSIKKALELNPSQIIARNNLLFSMEYSNEYSEETRLNAAHEYGRVVSETATPYTDWNFSSETKRLRVGIVSGDLRQHPVGYFLKNVLKHLDSNQIELFAYTPDGRTDETTLELKPYFSEWKSLAGHHDAMAAKIIHEDCLHVLLDLSGHTSGNKLPIFAWKPAPVQASWLGYWATTGVEAIDYILVDKVGVPEHLQHQFTETIKYLPETRMCFTAPETTLEVAELPALKNGFITFGCFQTMAKVSDEVFKLWATVLKALPNSRLRWQCKQLGDAEIIKEVKARMSKCGIDTKQVSFYGKVLREEYLAAHAEVDVILDSFPFTGGTTTCEALWMGVPTLTLAGETMVARQGASLLTAAGLEDWIAESKQDYVQKAINFCEDLQKLAALRAALREKVGASSLFNGAMFAKNLEIALWEMWEEKQDILAKKEALSKRSQKEATASNDERQLAKENLTIEIVSATRMTEQAFWENAALGISLKKHIQEDPRISVKIAYENTRGLSEVFNESIEHADDNALLVFIHDDVWIDQAQFFDSVYAGLQMFDVIGVAGNKRRLPNQPGWAFVDLNFTWDSKEHLSGRVAHGEKAHGKISEYGPVPASCELMDGVFLATKKSTLINKQVKFDEQFDFHFYDLDFCRTARNAGLSLGTWPVKLTHQSGGAFGSQQWMEKLKHYFNKWENMSQTTLEKPPGELDQAINDVYLQAMQHQQNGDVEQAVSLYLEILQADPRHADANHNLGFIEAHTNSINDALPRFEAAVMASPETEQFWVSYIDALMQSGATETALSAIEHGQKFGLTKENAALLLDEYHEGLAHSEQMESLQPEMDLTEKAQQNVSVIQWQNAEKHAYEGTAFPESWLHAYPQSLMIEYTSRCNLRCKYCPKSNPGEDQVPGRNMDMVDETIDSVIDLIKQHPYQELLLAGTGESTFHPNWLEDFPRIISAGKQSNPSCYIHVNSNFAIKYEDVHWAVLSQLDGIVISIDTADRQLTKETRAKSDLGLIIYNIIRLQTYCESHGLKLPKITINVTLYQQAAEGLPELMIMLSKLPVSTVAISDLYEGKAATINGIKSINADDHDEFKAVIKHIEEAIKIAQSLAKFNFSIQPHLVERIQHIQAEINGVDHGKAKDNAVITDETKQTKLCLQPWTRFTLAADAAIFPCCVTDMEPVGRIDTQEASDGLDGEKLRNFRSRLLSGDVPSICVNCTNAPSCSTQQLQQAVQRLSETSHTIRPKQMVSTTKAEDGKRSTSQQDIETKIYQIFYSEETQKKIDQGFIPLDNLENSRPDWFEYWPIRNYLLNTDLDEEAYYGFLSPKFKEKTGLTSQQVNDYIAVNAMHNDVISFSPFFDQSSYYLNNFIQGMSSHSENTQTFIDAIAKIYPEVDVFNLVMDSSNTIFCNYFVAKPKFWREWLACCEKLFIEAEQNTSDLAIALNDRANYDGGLLPAKVFVIERVASLILATQPNWKVQAYDSKLMPMSNPQMGTYLEELTAMSDLKTLYLHDKDEQHLVRYYEIREELTTEMWHHKLKPLSLDQVLAFAQQLREENKPYEVEKIYRHVLIRDAKNAEANHYLGVLEAEQVDLEQGILKLETAVMANPQVEQYWVSYIDALMLAGAFDTVTLAIEEGKKHGLTANTAQVLEAENKQHMSALMLNTNNNLPIDSNEAISRLLTEAAKINVKQIDEIKLEIANETKSSFQSEQTKYIPADLDLSVFRETINTLISNHQVNEVLEVIHKSILTIKFYPAFVGHKIFTPYFDEVLSNLEIEIGQITPRKNKLANVVLATEVYNFGGHTKDIIAILKSIDNPILIMTDIYHQVAKQGFYEKIASSLPNCPVFILPKESFIDKATRLAGYINNYAKNVFLLSHHDDSVAIAACQKKLDVNYYFIHHADHNPALGNHVKHLKHVDLFEARSKLCQQDLHTETIYLPTTASDQGAKSFIYPIKTFSTVTAGTFAKFQTTGALSLASIVMASLQISRGHHYHFGEIPSEQLALIYAAINEAGYKDDHFVYMGNVPSLWQALLEIDAHIFIGSAPVMGAKSDIEAQGAGYPLLAYKEKHSPRHLNVGSHSAETIYWSNIDEFKHGLEKTMSSHQHLSQSARDFYLTSCSEEQFKQVIKNLSQ